MLLKVWRFATISLTALAMTMSFCHLWQLGPRMKYDAAMWFNTLSMYELLGPAGPGPFVECGAIVASIVLVAMVWHRRPARELSIMGAALLLLAFISWWILIYPVNKEMAQWTVESIPDNWANFRERWEYSHAARALMMGIALSAMVLSLLIETPDKLELSSGVELEVSQEEELPAAVIP